MTYQLRTHAQVVTALLSTTAMLSSQLAFSGGFEKPNTFSARWSGVAGAAASSVSGSESLYYNPAGLAAGEGMLDITGNFSPTWVQFSGPIGGSNNDSKSSFIPAFGAFANYKVTPKWGIGAGFYLAGGSRAIFDGVDFTNVSGTAQTAFSASDATVQANVSIVEASLGTGYEVIDGLRLGLGWRMAVVNGSFSSFGYNPLNNTLTTLTIDNLSATSYNGFKVGMQYYPKESRWGLGAQWRTQVNFTAQGDLSAKTTLGTASGSLPAGYISTHATGEKATISSTLPQMFELGGHYDILPSGLRMYLQYTFTNYSANKELAVAGTTTAFPGLGAAERTTPLTNTDLNWVNVHEARLGFDCFELTGWVFRAGYVLGSKSTPDDRARATLLPPGLGHTVTLGAGTKFLNNALETNLTLEYGWAEATTSGTTPPANRDSGLPGKYTASDYAAMLGVTYRI